MLVQRCVIDGEPVTVLYGHLSLTSITTEVGQTLEEGQTVATLGRGFSAQTDNERPHLHLSIHRGDAVELRGYAQEEAKLAEWIDPLTVVAAE
jgi:murein DD-endopeptidase MepM/ murein hydrolase activator NlpD